MAADRPAVPGGPPDYDSSLIRRVEREQRLNPDRIGRALLEAREALRPWIREIALRYLPQSGLLDQEWRDFIHLSFTEASADVRKAAAEAAGRLRFAEAIPDLIHLLGDRDYLVRVEAIEALWDLGASQSATRLQHLLENDPHRMVRGYAAKALMGVLGESALPVLENRLPKESSPWAKTQILIALCALGREDLLAVLLRRLKSRNYRLRCLVANSVDYFVTPSNRTRVRLALLKASVREPTVAAREALERALAKLEVSSAASASSEEA
jgi:HEAT repeat protein